jgi:hypothetical protein
LHYHPDGAAATSSSQTTGCNAITFSHHNGANYRDQTQYIAQVFLEGKN